MTLSQTRFKHLAFALLVPGAVLLAFFLFSAPPEAMARQEAGYAGIETCQVCHEGVVEALFSEEKSAMCLQCHEKGGKMFWVGEAPTNHEGLPARPATSRKRPSS